MKEFMFVVMLEVLVLGAFFGGVLCTTPKTEIRTIKVIPDDYIDTKSEEFLNNYIDMRQVTDFTVNENGLQLYTSDGSGYYWEK